MKNFICTQPEEDENSDYFFNPVFAYFHKEPTENDWEVATKSKCRGNTGLIRDEIIEWGDRTEVPSILSKAIKIKRYLLGGAK